MHFYVNSFYYSLHQLTQLKLLYLIKGKLKKLALKACFMSKICAISPHPPIPCVCVCVFCLFVSVMVVFLEISSFGGFNFQYVLLSLPGKIT